MDWPRLKTQEMEVGDVNAHELCMEIVRGKTDTLTL